MDPILSEIYSTVMPAAPYVIGAYALIWVCLLVYVLIIAMGTKKVERELAVLEDAVAGRRSDSD